MARYEELEWEDVTPPLDDSELESLQSDLGHRFPADYLDCLRRFHDAIPEVSDFPVTTTEGRKFRNAIAVLLGPAEIRSVHEQMGDAKDPDVIPFGIDGGGNAMCFDFRPGEGAAATVCYYQHEGSELYPLAVDFASFCDLLEPPNDDRYLS